MLKDILLFGAFFAGTQVYMHSLKGGDPVSLGAVGMIGAHFCGFGALELFGGVQREPPFNKSPGTTLLTVVPLLGLLSLLNFAVHKIRSGEPPEDETEEEKQEREAADKKFETLWIESAFDSAGFATGYLIAEAGKFSAIGELGTLDGEPLNKTQEEVNSLVKQNFCFIFTLFLTSFLLKRTHHYGHVVHEGMKFLNLTAQFTMGWSMLAALQWQWFVSFPMSTKSSGIMVCSLGSTMASIALIYVLDFLADREIGDVQALRSLIFCTSITVGLSWEKAFHEAEHSIAHNDKLQLSPGMEKVFPLMVSVSLALVVLPAWRWYILPKNMEIDEEFESDESEEEGEEGSEKEKRSSEIVEEEPKGVTAQ